METYRIVSIWITHIAHHGQGLTGAASRYIGLRSMMTLFGPMYFLLFTTVSLHIYHFLEISYFRYFVAIMLRSLVVSWILSPCGCLIFWYFSLIMQNLILTCLSSILVMRKYKVVVSFILPFEQVQVWLNDVLS